jgi:hypothetical protein
LTRSQGRRFGVTVGGAFLLLAAVVWWRGNDTAMTVFGLLGATLGLAGLVIPRHLGPVERAWMALAHAMSKVTTPVVMGAMYLLVLLPIGWLRRTLGGNPLVHRQEGTGFWRARPQGRRRSMSLRRQF